MPKILITGNGFDLFHHLPTKYGHFMAIMKTIEEYDFPIEMTFEDLFERCFKEQYSKDYDSILENYNIDKIKVDRNKIREIGEMLKTNSWYQHFKNVTEIETWIDFETEIESVLIDVSIILEDLRKDGSKYNFYSKDAINVHTDLSCFGFIDQVQLQEVSIKHIFLNPKNKKVKEKLILDELFVSLEQFTILFNTYLIEVVGCFYNNLRINYKMPLELIDKIYSVNYTSIIESIYNVDKSKIIYLHGRENINSDLQNLVLGVNDIPDGLKNSKAYYFTKYYQKIIKNSNPKFIEIGSEKNAYWIETIFYIIGHSLDKSDKVYLRDLFEFLESDHLKKSKICVFYYNKLDKESKLNNLFSIVENMKLVKMNEDGRLYFVKLNQDNIASEFNRKLHNGTPYRGI